MAASNYFVIIPVYNEQKHIEKLVKEVKKYTKNIIVVNDGSKDRTGQILKVISNIKIINLEKNSGKGLAMKVGAKKAWGMKAQGIVFIDGDYQHNPSYLPIFFKHLRKGHDVIIGVRILKASVPLYRKLGNNLLMGTVRVLFNISLPDILCGYRGFSRKGYNQLKWDSKGYGIETETIARIGYKKIKFETIIVDTIYLNKYKGFSIKDGLILLCLLPFWRLFKMRK